MIEEVNSEKLKNFLEMIGLNYPHKERLILLGGCA